MHAASRRTIHKKPHAYSNVAFNNVPSFEHLASDARTTALEQHEMWENALLTEPRAYLHRSCAGLRYSKGAFPRQILAFLISEYCFKNKATLDTLKACITRANGDVDAPGLFTWRPREEIFCVNLRMLDDQALYRVYCTIPEDQRGNAQAKSAEKRPVTDKEELINWICCDKCSKWRRISGTAEANLPDSWECRLHPGGLTCADPEDLMDADEKCVGGQAIVEGDDTEACATEPSEAAEGSEMAEGSQMGDDFGQDNADDL